MIGLLLLMCFGLTELHSIIKVSSIKVNLFLCPGLNLKQTVAWYIKDSEEAIIWIIFLIAMAIYSKGVIRQFVFVHLGYRIFDFWQYWWSFRQDKLMYDIAHGIILLTVIIIVIENVIRRSGNHIRK